MIILTLKGSHASSPGKSVGGLNWVWVIGLDAARGLRTPRSTNLRPIGAIDFVGFRRLGYDVAIDNNWKLELPGLHCEAGASQRG